MSHYNGKHRTRSDAYLKAGRLIALVTVAALTVAAGSVGAASTRSDPKVSDPGTVALASLTNTGPPASLFRNPGRFTSRSRARVGLQPQNLVEVGQTASVLDGLERPGTWQRREDLRVATAEAITEKARVAKAAREAAKAAQTAKAAKAAKAAKEAAKARADAAHILAVEAAVDAERARVVLLNRTNVPSTAATVAAKTWAAAELTRMGYEPEQFTCLDLLWARESGWNPLADNPTSTAYGIPQALPGTKMAAAGADWLTNPKTQITWGLGYIKARYDNPCRAWEHSESENWY